MCARCSDPFAVGMVVGSAGARGTEGRYKKVLWRAVAYVVLAWVCLVVGVGLHLYAVGIGGRGEEMKDGMGEGL